MKKLFTLFTAGLALLCLSFTGCSNSADGGDGKNISATQGDNGIEVTVQAPEGCSVIYFIRTEPGSTHEDYWYLTEKATAGANTATDYFTEANKTYIYYAQFYDANWKKMDKSDSVEINSSVNGLDSPVVTNVPKATYNSGTRKFTFTTKPTFSYTQSKVEGYPNLVIDLLFKTADEDYETICTYRLGDDSTGEVLDWVFNKHPGKTMEFVNFKFKLKSADYKTSYEWDAGRGADIPAITLDGFARLSTTTVEDFLGKSIATDTELTSDELPTYGIKFANTKTGNNVEDVEVYLDNAQNNNISVVIAPATNQSDGTCIASLTISESNGGQTQNWRNNPIYFLFCRQSDHVFVEHMKFTKTTNSTGLSGTYLSDGSDENDYVKVILGSDGTASMNSKHDSQEESFTGTYRCNEGIITIDFGNAGTQNLIYKSNGIIATGEYLYYLE